MALTIFLPPRRLLMQVSGGIPSPYSFFTNLMLCHTIVLFGRRICAIATIAILGLSIPIDGKSIAGDITLLSIGPRYGFSGKSPLLGKQQTYNFNLLDVAATFRLPWSWPLGESPWSIETRLITSAGALYAAGDTGFIAAVHPDVALTGWNNLVSIDVGVGLALLGRQQYGIQD